MMADKPLRLYEVVEVILGESMRLQDLLLPESAPVLVQKKSGSRQTVRFDLIAARVLPVASHFELSGAAYAFPRNRSNGMIAGLRRELEGIDHDSVLAKDITGCIIPFHWLRLFVTPMEPPRLVDLVSGDFILLITDHYLVKDWPALEEALSSEADVEGNRKDGWQRAFDSEGGLKSNAAINPCKRRDRLSVFYRTQPYADAGWPWFERVAGQSVAFISREISDPRDTLSKLGPDDAPAPPAPVQLPPGDMTELL